MAAAFHLSLAQPVSRDLALACEGARYPGGLYMLTAGVRLFERGGNGQAIYAQVMAGLAFGRDGWSTGMLQPGFGVDLRARGPAAVRLQLDWPLITFGGAINLTPQLSAGLVFRAPEP